MRAVAPRLPVAIVFFIALLGHHAHAAEVVKAEGGVAVGRDIVDSTVVVGLTAGQVRELVERIVSETGVDATQMVKLATDLGVHQGAIRTFLRVLGEKQVPVKELPAKLAEIAKRHKSLLRRFESIVSTDPDVEILKSRARAAVESGDYDRAERLLANAEEHALARVDRLLSDAATLRAERGELERARLNYRSAMEHFRVAAGLAPASQPLTRADYLTRQGLAAWEAWDLDAAGAALERALELREANFPGGSPEVAESLHHLGGHYFTRDRYDEAERLLERALAMRTSTLGADHPKVAQTSSRLAQVYEDTGRYAEAETLFNRAIAIAEAAKDADPADVTDYQGNLAALYHVMGRYAEAEALFNRIIATQEPVLGPDHPSLAVTLFNLGALYQMTGRFSQAVPLYQRVIAIDEKALGSDHGEVAVDLNNLAMLYWMMGRYDEARALLERAVPILERHFGERHPTVRTARRNLKALTSDMEHGVATPLEPAANLR